MAPYIWRPALSVPDKVVVERRSARSQPDKIKFAPGLPKTRSGKIMRVSCARSPRTIAPRSAIPQPLPIRPS